MTFSNTASFISKRLRDERGFTLVELLTSLVVGGFVISAAIMLVVMSLRASVRVADRVNAAAVGRSGMELITQRVRSQSCLYPGEFSVNGTVNDSDGQNSILYAGPTEIAFIGDLSNQGGATNVTGSVGYQPSVHYVVVTPRVGARGWRIVAATDPSTTSSAPFNWAVPGGATTFTGLISSNTTTGIGADTPTSFTSLADGVTQVVTSAGVAVPYFQYYDQNNVGATGTALAYTSGSLGATALSSIAKVTVAFTVLGESGFDKSPSSATGATAIDNRTATFQSDIALRTDPDACG